MCKYQNCILQVSEHDWLDMKVISDLTILFAILLKYSAENDYIFILRLYYGHFKYVIIV